MALVEVLLSQLTCNLNLSLITRAKGCVNLFLAGKFPPWLFVVGAVDVGLPEIVEGSLAVRS